MRLLGVVLGFRPSRFCLVRGWTGRLGVCTIGLRNVVYQPHLYPPGLDGLRFDGFIERLKDTFDAMVKQGSSWGGPVVIGEWGRQPNDERAEGCFDAIYQPADERLIGLAFWLWKEHCQAWWGFYDYTETGEWSPRREGIEAFSRPRALAMPVDLRSHCFDPKTRVFEGGFRQSRRREIASVTYTGTPTSRGLCCHDQWSREKGQDRR